MRRFCDLVELMTTTCWPIRTMIAFSSFAQHAEKNDKNLGSAFGVNHSVNIYLLIHSVNRA